MRLLHLAVVGTLLVSAAVCTDDASKSEVDMPRPSLNQDLAKTSEEPSRNPRDMRVMQDSGPQIEEHTDEKGGRHKKQTQTKKMVGDDGSKSTVTTRSSSFSSSSGGSDEDWARLLAMFD